MLNFGEEMVYVAFVKRIRSLYQNTKIMLN
jgi:hypothetical protein